MEMNHSFSVGDIVRFQRGEYSHVAIYAGRDRVIHLWSPTSDRAFQVRIDSLRHVQHCVPVERSESDDNENVPNVCNEEMDIRMHREYGLSPFDGEIVVERARTRLGETRYNCVSYNCEHFVAWARYGVESSPQVTSHINQVLAGALLGAVVGGGAGLVVGSLISLFSKVQALSASASIGDISIASDGSVEIVHEDEVVDLEQLQGGESEADRLRQRRREREILLETVSTMQLENNDRRMEDYDTWASGRHRTYQSSSVPAYGNERHLSLATRLAEDKLQCGICFYDLQLTKALAFPCDHFTCAKCFHALVTNHTGQKCCPYCRMNILEVHLIHRSTKAAAREQMTREDERGTYMSPSRMSPISQ